MTRTRPQNGTAQQTTTPAGTTEVPWNLVVPTVDVHLVGYGNRLPNDFTLEMLAVLRRCNRIFGVPPIHAPDFGIPTMESLLHLYGPGKPRIETYAEMVETVLDAAITDPPVAFATYGSAMVGTLATHRILEEASRRGLTVHVTNAVSSFDGIWADFNIEPFFGFEIWEASAFARLEIEPNTRANLLLPQAPVFDVVEGIDPDRMTMRTSTTITVLRDHLLRFYPADHMVHYIKTGSGAGPRLVGADVESIRLHDLDHPGRQQGSTLLVPRVVGSGPAQLDFDRPGEQARPR
jgi:Protein containing tetrapyrrole methyltransferase domain and MazG-like (predicted pyrophosphatase) domain